MIGRITKSMICIAAVTAMSSQRDIAADLGAFASAAPQAIASQASAACAQDLDRCVSGLRTIADLIALTAPESRDTLTPADRAAAPARRGG